MSRPWTIVLRGDFYLPHLVNMLDAYRGNGEQRQCADEMIAQIRDQITGPMNSETTRPLVVIDPEDREQLHRLRIQLDAAIEVFTSQGNGPSLVVDAMQAALREFANPTPPKPEEPTGLGAVVRDDRGRVYTRYEEHDPQPWWWNATGPDRDVVERRYAYADITVVEVLREGVTS